MQSNLNKIRHLVTLLAAILCFTLPSMGQERVITGKVVYVNGEPVIGATVLVTGTMTATSTGINGDFSLKIPAEATTFEVTYIGYKKQVVTIGARTAFPIRLEEDAVGMDEVVVIGYGTSKRGNLSGSVTKIDAEVLENRDASNIATALQGILTGVEVRTTSGEPGSEVSIRVRGSASVNAESEPLYVVDGIPVDNISDLNASDIQSIEVLKDASSAAIYGSRGANGVVIISTKMPGKDENTKVQFTASFGIQQIERKVDLLTPEEWIDFRTRYNNALYVAQYGAYGATADDDYETRLVFTGGSVKTSYVNDPRWTQPNHGGLKLIDWQDEFFRLAPKRNYQVSVSDGTSKTNYRISAGMLDQQGVAIGSSYRRLNMQARMQSALFDDKLTIGFDIRPTISKNEGGRVDGKDNMANRALTMCPIAEPEAGIYSGAQPYPKYDWGGSAVSPVAYMEQVTNESSNINLVSSMFLEANLAKGLKANVTGSYTYKSSETHRFVPSSVTSGWQSYDEGYRTTARRNNSRSERYLLQATLNYDRTFDAHEVSAMAGYSMESSDGTSSQLNASQFPNNTLESFNDKDQMLTSANASFTMLTRLVSFFGRVQYAYDNRYSLTASIREDGSSRLGSNNRWGLFPALSAAWRISNEPFWRENDVVNQLKLRGSWGINGNNRISATAAMALMSSANYSLAGGLVNGFAPTSIENANLGWERTHSWNVALDLSMFQNRLQLTVEYYDKLTKDLLYQVSVPAVVGFEKAWDNVGSIRNRGFEIELTSHNLNNRNFKWDTNLNLSYNKNIVESLGEDNTTVFTGYDSITQVLMVGQPIGAYYLYDAVGVYQYQSDLQRYPVMKGTELGDVRYRDVNDDGIINDDDRTLVGSPAPDFTYGMTNTLRYKRLELSVLITAQTGGTIFSALGRAIDRPGMNLGGNVLSCWKNMWVSEEQPGDGKTPGIANGNTGSLYDTRWLYSTDFIKIKNITLSYNFKTKKTSLVKGARIYFTAENVWMWDKYYGGFSPETNNGNLLSAYDYGAYPQARVFTIGANLTF
ncbi:MAG: TonB-dependent receptor [Tidjanibacter sp.]|nr:TonB-dependent receptor [Tidjanibacter sp.]